MAYKQEYSEEDLKAFVRKDKLNARMSALKAASTNCEGKEVVSEDLLGEANKYYNWLVQDQDWKNDTVVEEQQISGGHILDNSTDSLSLPVPTVAQKKWLDNIQQKYGFTAQQVFDAFKKYPSDKNEAVKVTQILRNTK